MTDNKPLLEIHDTGVEFVSQEMALLSRLFRVEIDGPLPVIRLLFLFFSVSIVFFLVIRFIPFLSPSLFFIRICVLFRFFLLSFSFFFLIIFFFVPILSAPFFFIWLFVFFRFFLLSSLYGYFFGPNFSHPVPNLVLCLIPILSPPLFLIRLYLSFRFFLLPFSLSDYSFYPDSLSPSLPHLLIRLVPILPPPIRPKVHRIHPIHPIILDPFGLRGHLVLPCRRT